VEQDYELHEVGVGLLPEGFLAFAEEVVEERRDAIGESIGVEVVVERIVPVRRVEPDLECPFGKPA
jgi:hypothetical protein